MNFTGIVVGIFLRSFWHILSCGHLCILAIIFDEDVACMSSVTRPMI